jgi:hypothetical protein
MISKIDISGKSDAELLEIWQNQVDYREDVVEFVSAEIGRRGLSTEDVQLLTVEDQARREEQWHSSVRAIGPMVKWGVIGLVLLLGGLTALWQSLPKGEAEGELFGAALLIGGIFFLWLARRQFKRRRG